MLSAERAEAEAVASAEGRLIAALDGQIAGLRDLWALAGRVERAGLLPRIKALRAERDALRGAFPLAPEPAPTPDAAAAQSDDPEDLRQEADALYDAEDKLRREEKALAARVDELKAERDLERRMGDFLREGALFDEGERRIAATSQARAASSSNVVGGGAPTGGAGASGAPGALAPPPGTTSAGRPDLPADLTRGALQWAPDRRAGAAYSEEESLEDLAARRAKVRALADDARKRADDAVRRARELR